MKLYVLVITDTQEYSILLYMNSTVESNLMIRCEVGNIIDFRIFEINGSLFLIKILTTFLLLQV